MTELMEKILSRENMMQAYKKVKAKNGASGVDGIGTEEIREYLIENWEEIREQTTACFKSGDTEAKWGNKKPRHTERGRPHH